jgi:hypothetical protein
MFIKDLVKLDQQGWFSTAVQLSDYDNEQSNLALVQSYIFAESAPSTHGAQSHAVGSIDLLRHIRSSYINNGQNRFVVIANYGHGKSHLALILANYLAKSYRSTEVKKILSRLEQSLNDAAKSEDFHEFKRQNDQFLVIRLRGDTPRTLREQFFPALKAAFQANPKTRNVELPFWNQKARQWLEGKLRDTDAKKYLKQFDTDIPTLIQEVEENKPGAYDQYVQLFSFFNNGVPPSAEGNFSLREAVIWAVENYCGDRQPFSGMAVLFDEFSQFIQRYSQSKAIGDLQDLLQGIGDKRGQAVFLAFAQHDPDEFVEQLQAGQVLQNLKKELGRLDRKFVLYSLMESVLDAYLAQSPTVWSRLLQEGLAIKGQIFGDATELVWDLYSQRYNKELRWTNDKFRKVVTEGCFPLHPVTTALLCHLKMQQGEDIGTARTVLGFVRDRMEVEKGEPVVRDGRINWILPIALVDYFGARIVTSPLLYAAYENAKDSLDQVFSGKDIGNHHKVLKALLLQEADKLTAATGDRQTKLIAQMTGLDEKTALQTLKELHKNNVTKHDAILNYNCLWPATANPQILEQRIKGKLDGQQFGLDTLYALNDALESLIPGLARLSVSVDWGTSEDWAAAVKIISKEAFTKEKLQDWMQPHRLTYAGFQDGSRGLVGWLLAQDESDVAYFREHAAKTLKSAFPEDVPPPVVLVRPQGPNKALVDSFMRWQALEAIGKDKDTLKEIGQTAYDQELERTKKALVKAFEVLFGDLSNCPTIGRNADDLIVPASFRASVIALSTIKLQTVLEALYKLAYPNRPPRFFTDLPSSPKRGPSPLRDGTKTVAKNLIHNRVSNAFDGMAAVPKRICKDYLASSWGVLSTTYWIQEPQALSLKRAWDYLEDSIKPGGSDIHAKDLLPQLLKYPFGFDYNSALLLFCAWLGRHGSELRLSLNGMVASIDQLEALLDREKTPPQDVLSRLCTQDNLTISRRDVDKALNEGRAIIKGVEQRVSCSQEKAKQDASVLQEIIAQNNSPASEKQKAEQAFGTLNSALELAKAYDQSVQKILSGIAHESGVRKLLDYHKQVQELAFDDLVAPNQPSASEIQDKVYKRLEIAVSSACTRAVNLDSIDNAGIERNELRDLKEILQVKGMSQLVTQVSTAEGQLEERIKGLRVQSEEAVVLKQIAAMTSRADLMTLRGYQAQLREIEDGSDAVVKARTQKAKEIEKVITDLETSAANILSVVTAVKPGGVTRLYEATLQSYGQYAKSEYEDNVKKAKAYLDELRTFLQELASIENIQLNTMSEVEKVKQRVQRLGDKYSARLSKAHLALTSDTEGKIESRVAVLCDESEQWVVVLETGVKAAQLSSVKSKLARPPAFLTPDLEKRIMSVRAVIQDREEQDIVVKIENLFASIGDAKKRKECIKRLEKLM